MMMRGVNVVIIDSFSSCSVHVVETYVHNESQSTAMLPEAYEEGGDFAGVFTLLGFLAALWVKLSFESASEPGAVCSSKCPA